MDFRFYIIEIVLDKDNSNNRQIMKLIDTFRVGYTYSSYLPLCYWRYNRCVSFFD